MGGEIERAAQILDRAVRQTYKEEDGKALVNTYQDVEPHLEYAAKCRRADAEERGAFGRRGELRRTMSVPFNVLLGIAQKLGIPAGQIFDKEHQKRLAKELKSSEYRHFRTTIDKHI
jgi:hypothetical protein